MKNRLLYFFTISLMFLGASAMMAKSSKKSPMDRLLQKSTLSDGNVTVGSGYPVPFVANNNPKDSLQVSTGYYYVEFSDDAPDFWKPSSTLYDTTQEPYLWKRILPGPRCQTAEFWAANPELGQGYFRNPAKLLVDSTEQAFAGPIPIGFNFFYNGIRYDSFYVSTRGLIGLSNRRYFYDGAGNKTIPAGSKTGCYDPMSDDWFIRTRDTTLNYTKSLLDTTPDNFGYYYMACGKAPTNTNAGLRFVGTPLTTSDAQSPTAGGKTALGKAFGRLPIIAPVYGMMHLSQYNHSPSKKTKEDYSRVYYKVTEQRDKLIIYVVKALPIGTYQMPTSYPQTYTFIKDQRPNDSTDKENSKNYIEVSYQVVLNKTDSSVTVNYMMTGKTLEKQACEVIKYNNIMGLSGRARTVNPDTLARDPWKGEYTQSTVYCDAAQPGASPEMNNNMAIKYKQWKNLARITSIEYWGRSKSAAVIPDKYTEKIDPTKLTESFELLAGDERLGSIQPVCIIQNLSSNLQGKYNVGVNSTIQALKTRVLARVYNSVTKDIIYNQIINVDSMSLHANPDSANNYNLHGDKYAMVRYCDAAGVLRNYALTPARTNKPYDTLNGIQSYDYAKIYFPPFRPSELQSNNIGRMRLEFTIDPTDPKTKEPLEELWPFDDVRSSNVFVMKRLTDFQDDFSEWYQIDGAAQPSVLKWVPNGVEIADGDESCYYPLMPRGTFPAVNTREITTNSPCLLMDRNDANGGSWNQPGDDPAGDEIRSFPIDLLSNKYANPNRKFEPVVTFSVQRGKKLTKDGRDGAYPGDYCESNHNGPENRLVRYSNPQTYQQARTLGAGYFADEILLQYAMPSVDQINNITNIETWGRIPANNKDVTGVICNPYILYGGGGYVNGFSPSNRELMNPYVAATDNAGGVVNGFVPDLYDDGLDFDFKKIVAPIPSSIVNYTKGGAKNFRFRIKVNAHNNKGPANPSLNDDNDPFYVDNVRLIMFSDTVDLELSSIRIVSPYGKLPASQASALPISCFVSNNTLIASPNFFIQGRIYAGGPNPLGQNNFFYCRAINVPFIGPSEQISVELPGFNARKANAGKKSTRFIVEGTIFVNGGDQFFDNNTNYSIFNFTNDSLIAYDLTDGKNHIAEKDNSVGLGISFPLTTAISTIHPANDFYLNGGAARGSSGQIAVKAVITEIDTVAGFQVWFGALQQALDQITFRIYKDTNGIPGDLVANSTVMRQRGLGKFQENSGIPKFDRYIDYYYDKSSELPVRLLPGTYWFAISQDGETCLELAGNFIRLGSRVTILDATNDHTRALFIDKTLRIKNKLGLINNDFVAYQNITGSGPWVRYMETDKPWGLWRYNYAGDMAIIQQGTSEVYSRTAYAPNFRINFGTKETGNGGSPVYVDCIVPVELNSFDGRVRGKGIDLFWETASENKNSGFNIERREIVENQASEWTNISFVSGQGFSSAVTNYSFYDDKVSYNKEYQYRLRTVETDGTLSCEDFSKTLNFKLTAQDNIDLKFTSSNPFDKYIGFTFTLNQSNPVKIEVVDLFGNLVKTIVQGEMQSGSYSWDGLNESGVSVSDGAYILKLSYGNSVKTLKMTLNK